METKMNKIALSLVALAAISTASFAGTNRNYDLRDVQAQSSTTVSAFAVAASDTGTSNAAIIKRNMMRNESSSH
jgi:hypothetical protein